MPDLVDLRDRVSAALRNAAANGFHFSGWAAGAIALDMITCDAALENEDLDAVTAMVRNLRSAPAT